MKYFIAITLQLITLICLSQDIIKSDSIPFKKNFLVFNASLQYNIYQGERKHEYTENLLRPSTSFYTTAPTYVNFTIHDTYGFFSGIQYRHHFTKNVSIQQGVLITYRTEKITHDDSVKNETNSLLKTERSIQLAISYTFNFNYSIKRFVISSGITIPLLYHEYTNEIYADKSVKKYDEGFQSTEGDLYFSENIQYKLFKKQNIYLNAGVDVSPNIIRKYYDGYNLRINGGIVYLAETKSHHKKKTDDYVQ
jgi:hypothetical protein